LLALVSYGRRQKPIIGRLVSFGSKHYSNLLVD
jgi:hypothetical protein